jgi:hypothetical protein
MNALHITAVRPLCHSGKITICHQAFQSVEHSCTDLVTLGEAAVMDQPGEAMGTVECEWSASVKGKHGQVAARSFSR